MSGNPFSPDFKAEPLFTARELGNKRAGRKTSQRLQAVLDRDGPTRVPTTAERQAAKVKNAKIVKGAL